MSADGFRFRNRGRERGYILLVLLLFVALMSIGFVAMVERLDFQIKRDREEELIHRGVQYSRAVRKFVKKFGRYPSSVEELENTNNIRFLRRRYKDPITGKDFRVLHNSDLKGVPSSSLGVSVANIVQQQPPVARAMRTPIVNPVVPGGPSADSIQDNDASANPAMGDINGGNTDPNAESSASVAPLPSQEGSGSESGEPVVTVGGVVGVASLSKEKTIRVFNKKDRYNQWEFAYDPTSDKGLLQTPRVPLLQVVVQQMNQDGAPSPGSSPLNSEQPTSTAADTGTAVQQ